MFIESFSHESHDEKQKQTIFQCTLNAIKAFKANIVIILNDKIMEKDLKKNLNEDMQFMEDNRTVIV